MRVTGILRGKAEKNVCLTFSSFSGAGRKNVEIYSKSRFYYILNEEGFELHIFS